jgi:hypothetical protein
MTPEMARRNPQYAASAAESLKGLRAQGTAARQVANQEALIASLSSSGGTIPFETAMKLESAGLDVPTFAVGMSPAAAQREIQSLKQLTLQSINDAMMEGLPESTAMYLEYVLSMIPEFESQLAGGGDPTQIINRLRTLVNRHAEESGTMQVAQRRQARMKAMQEGK